MAGVGARQVRPRAGLQRRRRARHARDREVGHTRQRVSTRPLFTHIKYLDTRP